MIDKIRTKLVFSGSKYFEYNMSHISKLKEIQQGMVVRKLENGIEKMREIRKNRGKGE